MSDGRPTVVVSDLHLGRRGMVARAEELAPIVEGASSLVVNGDVAELHIPEWAAAAARELEGLEERCRRSGTTLVMIAGNHDPELTPRRHLLLADGAVLVTHGDAVDEALAPWSDAAAVIRDRHRTVMASMTPDRRESLEGIFEAAREAAKAEAEILGEHGRPTTPLAALLKPRKVVAIARFWWTHARRMHAFAARHAATARVVLVGHSHRAGIVRRGRRTIVNTGCFGTPGPALAVTMDDTGLAVRRVTPRGREPNRRWFLVPGELHRDPDIRIEPTVPGTTRTASG